MKTHLLLIYCLGFISFPILAQQPNWVSETQRNLLYPESHYLTGFVSEENLQKISHLDFLQKLQTLAQKQLIESVKIDIQSQNTLQIQNINQQTKEQFEAKSLSFSRMDLTGLQQKTFYDTHTRVGYALVFVQKDSLIAHYQQKTLGFISQIRLKLESITHEKDAQVFQKTASSAHTLMQELQQTNSLLQILSKKPTAQLSEIVALETQFNQLMQTSYPKQPSNTTAENTNQGFIIDIRTNKGQDNVLYSEGEEARFEVQSNRSCYLRFIYLMADGTQVLLLDNYYLSGDKANQWFQIPYTFECAEPFGLETLQLNASTEKFDPLLTHQQSGYTFIQGSLEDSLLITRGLKKKKGVLTAEKSLSIITRK
jgi:hypothetical protein